MEIKIAFALASLLMVCALFIGSIIFFFKKSLIAVLSIYTFIISSICILVTYALSKHDLTAIYVTIPLCIFLTGCFIAIAKFYVQSPLKHIEDNLKNISKGKLNNDFKSEIITRKDELGKLASIANTAQQELHKTAEFAKSISERNFDTINYTPLSENDEIGNLLIDLRENLIETEQKENERKTSDQNAKFVTTGIAKFADILRQNNDDLNKLSYLFVKELVNYISANQGALYILVDDDDSDEPAFELISSIAYERERKLNSRFYIGDGLVGRCAFEQQAIYMSDVPENYINITSGLGTSNPKNILLTPAVMDNKVYAVIEIASFNTIEPHIIELIEKISENIASTFSGVRKTIRNMTLLEESKQYSEEMAAQEEELRQNIEELQATQEEMVRKEEKLKAITGELEAQEQVIKEKLTQLKYIN